MIIYRFFPKLAAVRHLGFVVCVFAATKVVVFIIVQNVILESIQQS